MKIKNFQLNNKFSQNNKIDWFLGIVIGDGSVSDRYVRVYSNNVEITQNCKEILNKEFLISEKSFKIRNLSKERGGFRRRIETTELGINSVELTRKIKKMTKRLLKNPTSSFIQGLFDAEGSVDLAGNIIIWQRKNESGNMVIESIAKFFENENIKYRSIRNSNFHIMEIPGRYKNYQNLIKFSEIIGFLIKPKQKDLNLILEIFSEKQQINRKEIINYISTKENVTIRNVIEKFKIPKMSAYRLLNKLVDDKKLLKSNSYPNTYNFCWHSTKR